MSKTKVVISGIFFPVTAMLEYIIRAFQRREDIEVLTIGSYHGTSIPWSVVQNLPESYICKPDIPLPAMGIGTFIPSEFLENQVKIRNFEYDLWLHIDAGLHLNGRMTGKGIKAVVWTDTHCLRDNYNKTWDNYDFKFSPQMPYIRDNEIYLPYGYDPVWHYPEERTKNYDVIILGNHYTNRIELINRLASQGKRTLLKLGLKGEDARELYNQSIISANWSSLLDTTARCFETMGNGTILLANRVPDLMGLFVENEDFYGFGDINEANAKVDYILSHLEEAYQVAQNGHKKVLALHTWDHRVQTILETVGLVERKE